MHHADQTTHACQHQDRHLRLWHGRHDLKSRAVNAGQVQFATRGQELNRVEHTTLQWNTAAVLPEVEGLRSVKAQGRIIPACILVQAATAQTERGEGCKALSTRDFLNEGTKVHA